MTTAEVVGKGIVPNPMISGSLNILTHPENRHI